MTVWDDRAETYPLDLRESLSRAFEIVRKETSEFGTAADIGCGPGNFTYPLSTLFGKVYASDLSPNMLARVRRVCGERGITNVDTVESDAQELTLPGRIDLAFSSLCSGIWGLDGLKKLDSLSDDLCIYITHDPDESTIDMTFYDDLGLKPFTHEKTLDYIDEFGKDHDITVERIRDSNLWKSREEATERFLRNVEDQDHRNRIIRYFEENDPTGKRTYNGKAIVYWHKK